jgi:hypothetical protein
MQRISVPNSPEMALEYAIENETELGPCPDCGQKTRRVWGYVYRSDIATAAYYVEWTPSHLQRDAAFDLIIGKWGENAGPSDRLAVSVAFRVLDTGPAFMVQDASERRVGTSPLVSRALNRTEVVGQPIAADVFQICDSIYLADPRINELRT